MSDAVHLAKAAREHLAAALKALQSNADAPAELLDVAEPIAETMSVLHRIERTNGANLEGRDRALVNVRAALDKLQQVSLNHPATDLVMDAVASSLSKVHALARYVPPSPPPAAAPPSPPPAAAPPRPTPQPIPGPPAVQQVPVAAAPQPVMTQAVSQPLPAESYARPTPPPQQAPPQPVYAPPPQPTAYVPPAPAPIASHAAATTVPATPSAGRIDVELGIHSTSNFYKGLSGNDVLDAGGIFVATYKVLKIGATVNLRVLLPGDYEFNAIAVVQWTRAAGDGSEPGFGARFTQIAAEGQKLVHRYARNREPIFYDDL
jgi:Tfp pilus assembly protein PilZ